MTFDDLPHQVSSQSDLNEFRPKDGHYHATDTVHKHAQSRFIKEGLRKGEHQHDAELQVRGRVHVIACDCT
jgi:hypothetical protein